METLLRRHQTESITRALATFPVVALTGARQVGKSTLARIVLGELGGDYVTLDDPGILEQVHQDPVGFVRSRTTLTVIDEVQRAPGLLPVIKMEVDKDKRSGRFLLTGSANLLKMRDVTESLAGRAAWVELPPLTWSELCGLERPRTIDEAFRAASAAEFVSILGSPAEGHAGEARLRAVQGGMPGLIGFDAEKRRVWYDAYRTTFLERDLRQLSQIENLPDFNRLASLAMLRTATLLNKSALAADASLNNDTATRYLNILEVGYQLFELSPYLPNLGKRLVKRPKIHANDVGMAAHIANVSSWEDALSVAMAGPLMESWVVNELRAIDGAGSNRSAHHYWRTSAGAEADLVLERGTEIVAIEVKSAASVGHKDTLGLRSLAEGLGERFRLGIITYTGDESRVLAERIALVPAASLLGVVAEN